MMRPLLVLSFLCAAAPAIAASSYPNRTCEGRQRHYVCHWPGGAPASDVVVPPDEYLGYGSPTLTHVDRLGRIHMVVGSCEIDCAADR